MEFTHAYLLSKRNGSLCRVVLLDFIHSHLSIYKSKRNGSLSRVVLLDFIHSHLSIYKSKRNGSLSRVVLLDFFKRSSLDFIYSYLAIYSLFAIPSFKLNLSVIDPQQTEIL